MKTQDLDTNLARRQVVLSMTSLLLVAACGGSPTTSSGLKIFVTARLHIGNFSGDPSFSGQNGIEKADDFCQTDANKPATGAYKAILVDGVTRDALIPLDWVLKPNTPYFLPKDDVRIATTTPAAIFPWTLEHSIHDSFGVSDPARPTTSSIVWTGFSDGMFLTAGTQNCSRWTYGQNGDFSPYGVTYGTDGSEWYTNGGQVCSGVARIYCVEQ